MKKPINWSETRTQTGNGAHLPKAIFDLASPDEKTRHNAYWRIDNYVVVQSSLYEAAYYVIEPIVRLLERPYTVDRLHTLYLLTELMLGVGSPEEITLQDTGEKTTVTEACRNKLLELLPRIEKIIVVTPNEQEEKEFILETIGSQWRHYR